jgi:hypothetical protein
MTKQGPIAQPIAIQRLAHLTEGGIDVGNKDVDSLRVCQTAVVGSGFEFFQEIFNCATVS